MILAVLLVGLTASPRGEFSSLARTWGLRPADPARPGLWKAAGKTGEPTLLARIDTNGQGEVLRSEWSAENAQREVDLPEARFWSILDGFSQGEEWVETDPDALGDISFGPPAASLAQGFRCARCKPPLVAATWSPHGGTRLLVSRNGATARKPRLQVSKSVTESGILSAARQRGLEVLATNPCREGSGNCALELTGGKGESWSFARSGPSGPWRLVEASFPGPPWWNPEWDWDSLRIESPREFRLMLANWLDAEVDVDGARLLRPIEPILDISVAEWSARALEGLSTAAAVQKLAASPSAPSAIMLCETPSFRLSIDMFGRRRLQMLEETR